MPVVNNGKGSAVTYHAFRSDWVRACSKAGVKCPYDDLKTRGVSDFEGHKKKASGHKPASMLQTYDRKRMEVEPA